MKRLTTLLLFFTLVSGVMASDFYILKAPNDKGAITPKTIEAAFVKAGFAIADNRDMNGPYTTQFGTTGFDTYNLFTFYHPAIMEKLVSKHPEAGVFVPMSMGIYQKKGEAAIQTSVLTAEKQAAILGMSSVDPLLKELESKVRAALAAAMPAAAQVTPEYTAKPMTGNALTRFTIEVDEGEAVDRKDDVEMLMEDGLKPYGFVLANFTDYNFELTKKETTESAFEFYHTYSICKLKVIYATSQTRPETGAFAPCTIAIYKHKEEGELVVTYPSVYNWISSAALDDKAAIDELLRAQADMEKVLKNATE